MRVHARLCLRERARAWLMAFETASVIVSSSLSAFVRRGAQRLTHARCPRIHDERNFQSCGCADGVAGAQEPPRLFAQVRGGGLEDEALATGVYRDSVNRQ
eukprot:2927393-Pleurochrysis_carterae.AAC.1